MIAYKTIEGRAQASLEEKKSRFIAQLAHVENEQEALAFLDEIRAAHPQARHNVYAYTLREGQRVRYSDDGEPPRTSGIPTLEALQHAELNDIICVTTRYFGGTLLGTGGLVRAYTQAAKKACDQAKIVSFAECVDMSATIDYSHYDHLVHWLNEHGVELLASDFKENVHLELRMLAHDAPNVEAAFVELSHGQAELHLSQAAYKAFNRNL